MGKRDLIDNVMNNNCVVESIEEGLGIPQDQFQKALVGFIGFGGLFLMLLFCI